MKKYMINPVTGEQTEIETGSNTEDRTLMLERNVKELQEQLANAQKRVMELNDIVSSYKKEAGILEEEIRKALDITTTI
ncbi:MAG: hypothetical protein CBB70_12290 [Planctomycetaceae bacterium TMED10]|nr:MAG: hypothetical protein CBB70_12290 [Planctomycetaceae bacterium TMED10]|tara:strand:+ start:56 stop:292 length:237 start_codon:yes stop_codon:yes gene_type:complete